MPETAIMALIELHKCAPTNGTMRKSVTNSLDPYQGVAAGKILKKALNKSQHYSECL